MDETKLTIYEYKLKLLESKIEGEFALIRQELININESLQQRTALLTKINFVVITCIISSVGAIMFEILRKVAT